MTVDQQIQVWNALGTWLAGIATFAAVVVSLHLARKADSIRLQANAGIRLVFAGDGTPAEEHVGISAINRGDRPVTINSIGWRIGKGKNARHCIQPVFLNNWGQSKIKCLTLRSTGARPFGTLFIFKLSVAAPG